MADDSERPLADETFEKNHRSLGTNRKIHEPKDCRLEQVKNLLSTNRVATIPLLRMSLEPSTAKQFSGATNSFSKKMSLM